MGWATSALQPLNSVVAYLFLSFFSVYHYRMPLSIKANIDLLNPKRTVTELKELRALTSDANGAQRVAFTPKWVEARTWLRKKLEPLPVEIHNDAAGNTWTTLRGDSERALLIGGHMDSVPNGGWPD